MKLLHTADWQLGCSFRSFGTRAAALRARRVEALRRTLERARQERVDAFLIAGDLFEDNQVAAALVAETMALFAAFPDVPTFILPGNHDPSSGPGSIWARSPFATPPSHVRVFTEPDRVALGSAWLLASPLRQKLSARDPSTRLAELAQDLPADALRIGMTHGALAIEGRHQPTDHPIALDAATRAGLDYLAVGHWHGWQEFDQGRLVMPGTPEPDAFDHADGRYGALVELTGRGQPPRVERIELAALTWRTVELDLLAGTDARAALDRQLQALPAATTVLRIHCQGSAGRAERGEAQEWLRATAARFLAAEVVDRSTLALTGPSLATLAQAHPLLGLVLQDVARLNGLVAGVAPGPNPAEPASPPVLSPEEGREVLRSLGLDAAQLDDRFFATAHDLFAALLQEVAP